MEVFAFYNLGNNPKTVRNLKKDENGGIDTIGRYNRSIKQVCLFFYIFANSLNDLNQEKRESKDQNLYDYKALQL